MGARRRFGPFFWNDNAARYVDDAGRFVAQQRTVRTADDRITDGFLRLDAMIQPLLTGQIDVATWQQTLALELRRAHTQTAALGRGGWDQMTQADWGRVGRKLRDEYKFLQRFAEQVANGELSEAQIRARMRQYENGVWSSYWKGNNAAHDAAGFTEERRVLNPAEHCVDCIGYAAEGWVPIGTLPAPGEGSVCGHNCKCIKEFR